MIEPNDSAFATPSSQYYQGEAGLTKREYFAALAMQGIIAQPDEAARLMDYSQRAEFSVNQADALIAALNAKGEGK